MRTIYVTYCDHCVYIDTKGKHNICPFCNSVLQESDWELKEARCCMEFERKNMEEDIFRHFVKNNKNFNMEAYQNRLQISKEQEKHREREIEVTNRQIEAEWAARRAAEQANAPRCPTCGSTNLKKIDALDRAISVSFLGLASGKIGKSFKCNHCGYMW